jgi:hypothetical protein
MYNTPPVGYAVAGFAKQDLSFNKINMRFSISPLILSEAGTRRLS